MFGLYSELGPVPSYYLAEIISVDTEYHTCSIKLLRGFETYADVKIFRDPGNFNLPVEGDICVVFWDNKNIPIVIGTYPAYHKVKLDEHRYYNVQPGERMMQSENGQKLLFNKRGEILLTNWLSQGMEIYEKAGLLLLKSDSIKTEASGVTKRSGFTKRYSPLAKKDTNISALDITGASLTATTAIGVTNLVEDATIIKEPTLLQTSIYEHKVGNFVVQEDTALSGEIKNLESLDAFPLRSQTKYFDSTGLNYIEVAIDIYGNAKINIPATMALTNGVSIEGIASDFVMNFKNITSGSATTLTNNVNAITVTIEGTSEVNVNAPTVNIGSSAVAVNLGTAGALCDNLPNCLFTGASHTTTNTTVFV